MGKKVKGMDERIITAAFGLGLLLFNGIGIWVIRSYFTKSEAKQDRLEAKQDALLAAHHDCQIALPEKYCTHAYAEVSLQRAHHRIDELDAKVDDNGTRITRLESTVSR